METQTPIYRTMCWTCLRPQKSCFCEEIKPFQTWVRFVFLMHPKEAKKNKTGTGRISHLCLKNSEIIVGVRFNESKRFNQILNDPKYEPFVLYPGENSFCVERGDAFTKPIMERKKCPVVFILDGTWPCAKKMMIVNPELHVLPRLSFSSSQRSNFKIKHQPSSNCLSTIESVYHFLKSWKKGGHFEPSSEKDHQTLLDGLDKIVDFQIKCAEDPNLKSYRKGRFKEPEMREDSIKWNKRSIFFEKENFHHL